MLEAVKGYANLTDLLSGEKEVTCSAIKPLVEVINSKMAAPKTSDTPLTIEVKECIKHDINTRYQNEAMSLLLDICVFLDPRFKHRCSMEDEPVVKLMDEVKIKMKFYKLVKGYHRIAYRHEQREKGSFVLYLALVQPHLLHQVTANVSDKFKHELEMCLQYPSLDIDELPLQWWKLECKRLPLLSITARKYLCVCACYIGMSIQYSWPSSKQ